MATEYPVTERPEREPTSPGEMLRDDVLPALKLSVTEAARQLRITRQTLQRILAGEAAMTPELASGSADGAAMAQSCGCGCSKPTTCGMRSEGCGAGSKKSPPTQWAAETEATVENCLRALSRFTPGEKLCDVVRNPGTGQDQGGGFKREK